MLNRTAAGGLLTLNLKTLMWASILSVSRFLLGIAVFYEILHRKWFESSILIGLGAVTDFLDGWIARNFNQKTDIGAHLDHIGDKFFVLLSLVAFYITGKVELLPLLLLAVREISITLLRFYGLASSVSFFGKVKTTVEFSALIVLPYQSEIGNLLLWVSIFLAYLSALLYIKKPVAG